LECGGKVPIHRDGDTALDRLSFSQDWESKAPSPLRSAGALQIRTRPAGIPPAATEFVHSCRPGDFLNYEKYSLNSTVISLSQISPVNNPLIVDLIVWKSRRVALVSSGRYTKVSIDTLV